MNYALSLIFILLSMNSKTLFEFAKNTNINAWRVVNDGVMGGISTSSFVLNYPEAEPSGYQNNLS